MPEKNALSIDSHRQPSYLLGAPLEAFLLGSLSIAAFAPFRLTYLIFLVHTRYYQLLTRRGSPGWLGFWFGFGKFILGTSWIFNSMHQLGELPLIAAWLVTLLFAGLMSLFDTIAAILIHCFHYRTIEITSIKNRVIHRLNPSVFAAIMVLTEWLRGNIIIGFPWLICGYVLTTPWWQPFAACCGVFGLSFLIFFTSGRLGKALLLPIKPIHAIIALVSLLMLHPITRYLPCQLTHKMTRPLTISLIQSAVPQTVKWQLPFLSEQRHISLTLSHLESDVIVWPENAVPQPNAVENHFMDQLLHPLEAHHATAVVGEIGLTQAHHYTNRLVMMGNDHGKYDKQRLVPFGEYNPLHWLPNALQPTLLPFTDLSPGHQAYPLLAIHHSLAAPFICYEIAFNQYAFRERASAANWLLTTTDDSWFGYHLAQSQHLQMAQMRSAESGKPQAIVGNNGPTAFIDHTGKILKQTQDPRTQVLTATLTPFQGSTLFLHYGNWPVLILCIAIIILSRLPSSSTIWQPPTLL